MKKICLLILSIIIFTYTSAQEKILYFIPDTVEIKLNELLKKMKKKKFFLFKKRKR